ncbi:MAG: NAD(P)-dependent oxidoreductase [bacterium]|nr:NAD(P)-dependent oxidoreductase [bacterium]
MKVLITGTSGFLGARILRRFQENHCCIAPSHRELDICDVAQCVQVIQAAQPDWVIHVAAVSDVGECERNPECSYQVNVLGTENLAKACAAAGSRMLFMSSDQVYGGNQTVLPNREEEVCPINVYGRQKLLAEQKMRAILPDSIALRLSWMYDLPDNKSEAEVDGPDRGMKDGAANLTGMQANVKSNFLTQILDAVYKEKEVAFSDKEYRGITYAQEVAEQMETILTAPGGVYHFASPAADTTYRLARQVFEVLGKGQQAERLLRKREDAMPRSLAMTQERVREQGVYFSETLDGICRCLREHGFL